MLPSMVTLKLSNCFWQTETFVSTRRTSVEKPLSLGCYNSHVSVVRLLLKDPRVDVTLKDKYERTPLWWTSYEGRHEVIEWLIASGRDLGDVKNKKGKHSEGREYTALEIARDENKTEVVSLLERFMANPTQTRHEVRVKLGVLDELAAEVFALNRFPVRRSSSTQASCHFQSCYSHHYFCCCPLLQHCYQLAHGAADDSVPSCRWFNEAEYSSQQFRGCLPLPCRDASFLFSVRVRLSALSDHLLLFFSSPCFVGIFLVSFCFCS